jgi:competence protein ComEC
MRIVIGLPAGGLLVGAAAGVAFPELRPSLVWTAFLVLSLAAIAAWVYEQERLFGACVCASFAVGGALLAVHAWEQAWRPSLWTVFEELIAMEREDAAASNRWLPEEPSVSVVLTGVLRSDASPADRTVTLSLDVVTIDGSADAMAGRPSAVPPLCVRAVRGGVILSVGGTLASERMNAWRAGRTIRVAAQLQRPTRYLDEGVPDSERALARRGTRLVGSVKSGALVDVLARGSLWSETAAAVRARIRRVIAQRVAPHSPRAAAVVTAIVIGDRAGLDPATERQLQDSGTYHVIAISGGNIAILASLMVVAFRVAGLLGRWAMIAAIAVLLAYAYLVGGGASVNRATLMAVVYFASRALDLRGPPLNTLVVTAALLVAADPLSIADPAFLLTSGATLAILVTAPITPCQEARFPIAQAVSILTASLAAELALFPINAYFFSRVTIAGLVFNLAAIPLMAITQLAGMLLMPVTLLPSPVAAPVAALVGRVAGASGDGLVGSAALIRFAPFLVARVGRPAPTAVVFYYAALFLVWHAWRVSARARVARVGAWGVRAGACACLAGSMLWIVCDLPSLIRPPVTAGRLRVTFLDVGQGDAALVQFPRGTSMLVDAGGVPSAGFDIGDRIVAPVLRQRGVRRLDVLALTHGDGDHIGGAPAVVDQFRPRDVWEGIPVPPFVPLQRLRDETRAIGGRWVNLQRADRMEIDGVQVSVRHPGIEDWERQQVRNDDSVVIELRWGDVSFVMTGDIGAGAEAEVVPQIPRAPIRVLKVPHHGSRTSSSVEFIRALAPTLAIVSVGRSNSFGHPAPDVLERYASAGVRILRTDRDGEITVATDGHALEIVTFITRTP